MKAGSMSGVTACPVCLERNALTVEESCDPYRLIHCGACDLVFSHPMKSGVQDWYDRTYFIRHIAVDDRFMWYFSWALERLPAQGRLLDIACGTGAFVFYARQRGLDAHGIDFAGEAIEAGKRRFALETIFPLSLEAYRAQHPGETFDIVTLFEVLEHLESPVAFLSEVMEILRPGGYIAFSVPNRDRWPLRDFADYPPNHLTRWSLKSMRRLLEVAELEVLELRVTPVYWSMNFFFGYFLRVLLYRVVNRHVQGLSGTGERTALTANMRRGWIGKRLSQLRRTRDVFMWVPTILAFPFLYFLFDGYNVVGLARKKA